MNEPENVRIYHHLCNIQSSSNIKISNVKTGAQASPSTWLSKDLLVHSYSFFYPFSIIAFKAFILYIITFAQCIISLVLFS